MGDPAPAPPAAAAPAPSTGQQGEQMVRGHPFNVGPRYRYTFRLKTIINNLKKRVADFIGEGAYGVVVRAQDTEGAADSDNLGELKKISKK